MMKYASAEEDMMRTLAVRKPVSTSVSGNPLVFMPKMPVTSVGGSSNAVSTESR